VRQAVVRRDVSEPAAVSCRSTRPVAYWGAEGDSRLLNSHGEVFEANVGEVEQEMLPRLVGARRARNPRCWPCTRLLQPLFAGWTWVDQLELTGRGSWTAQLDTGAVLELGRGSDGEVISARAALRAHADAGDLALQPPPDAVESADLRHADGYALRLRGVSTVVTGNRQKKTAMDRTTGARYGKRIQGPGRRARHRHRQGDGGGGRGHAGRRAQARGLGVAPSNGLKRGVVVNIDATVQSIQLALKEAELMADCKITRVYTGITGSHIRGINSSGMVAVKDREVTQADVARVVETAKAINISTDQRLLLVEPQEFVIDGQDVKEPIGMSGIRLEAKVHIVTGAQSAAENIIKCVRRCGLEVEQLMLNPLASSLAVLTDDERELGVAWSTSAPAPPTWRSSPMARSATPR
jgi:hypothetical protein